MDDELSHPPSTARRARFRFIVPQILKGASSPLRPTSASPGFTLIETLIATAILAVLSAGAMLALRPTTDPAASDNTRLQTAFASQQALAIAGRDRRGLAFETREMQIMAWRDGAWQALAPPLEFRRSVTLDLGRIGVDPQIIFSPDGYSTPFTALLSDGARCTSDGWTGLKCAR